MHVTGDLVKVTRELIKLYKYILMKADILFLNEIPFLFCSVTILYTPR